MDCPKCGATDCIEIEINLQDHHDLHFHSCRACETKWWESDGDTLELDAVLDLASRKDK